MKDKKIALITGISGFVGSHMAELLLSKGFEVHGLCRWRSRTENIDHIKNKIHLIEGDLLDAHSLQQLMMDVRPTHIFHLAAQSYVPASWTSPAVTLEINVVGACNLFEAVKAAQLDPLIQIACCYDKETLAFTAKGFKKFNEINRESLVLSIDPETKEVSWKPVKKVIVDDYKGEMIHIKGKRVDLMVTPNHFCYFEDGTKGLKRVYAKDLAGDYHLPRGQSRGLNPKEIKGFSAKELFYLLGLYIGDGYGDANKREFVIKTGLLRDDYLKICRDKQGKFKKVSGNPGVGFSSTSRIFLAIPQEKKARRSTEQCLGELKIKFSKYRNCLYFSSKPLLKILKTSGEDAKTKHIPRWALDYSPELLKNLYRGLIDSDGSFREGRESFTTISKTLVESFVELCTKLGFTCTYRHLKKRIPIFKKRAINGNKDGYYMVSISHKSKQVRNSLNVYKENYKGKIWCVEVAGNHTLLVMRNGKIDFCGNSSEEYGLVKPDEVPIKETNPLRPLSPYGVSKVAMDYLGYQYFKSYNMRVVRTRGFNHSVSKWSPVLIRNIKSGLIDIKYICELRKYKSDGYMGGKLYPDGLVVWDMNRSDTEVWTDGEWSKIVHISSHPIKGNKLLRIVSRGGIVDVTDNHSLIGENGQAIEAAKLSVGAKIKLVKLPESNITEAPEEMAWFYGFFVAEGCVTGGRVRIYNKDSTLIDKCQKILLKYFAQDSYRTVDKKANVIRLSIRKPFKLSRQLREQCYASDGNKKIPMIILNAGRNAKLAFLRGFNDGDGLKKGYNARSEFKNFKTKSPILALGLCYLISNTTSQRFTLSFEERNTGYVSINLNSQKNPEKWGEHLLRPNNEISKIIEVPYEDEVWDFETEKHVFHTGIGGNLVHNTGPRRGEVFAESSFAKQIAEIEKGKNEPVILVGNLEAKRDYTDVRDMVRGYFLSVEKGLPGEVYNISSGKTIKIEKVLQTLLSFSKVKVEIKQDPARMRPSDVPILLGDNRKFVKQTGWKPTIPFEKTMKDLLDYWREKI